MNLHEYQAKELLAEHGLTIPQGIVASDLAHVVLATETLQADHWVIKAQIHAGGRGKAGGVKLVSSLSELEQVAKKLLGQKLVTYQTDKQGQIVNKVLIEKTIDIISELYLGLLVDRTTGLVNFLLSNAGGMDIEKIAQERPEDLVKIAIDPLTGLLPYQIRIAANQLKLDASLLKDLNKVMSVTYKLFLDYDLSMLEINPLVITKNSDGNLALVCLDCKINLDENALYRQKRLAAWRDVSQENLKELQAKNWDLNYIALEGNIGCMVNGAGLAMATMDLIKLHGGQPANFLDVGGSATKERVTEAFKILLSDEQVKVILVNIFGGIVRCDLIAEGIIAAIQEIQLQLPVVVRLEGNNADKASQILAAANLNILVAKDLDQAAKMAVSV